MKKFEFDKTLKCLPPLDADFKPIAIANREYRKALTENENCKIMIAIERENQKCSLHTTYVFSDSEKYGDA